MAHDTLPMQQQPPPAPHSPKSKARCVPWIVAAVVLGFLALLGYVASGPYRTLFMLKKALSQNDSALLAECVDFPTLRQNLKTQLQARANGGLNAIAPTGILSRIAGGIAGGVIDASVDTFVTPAGLNGLLGGASLAANHIPSVAGDAPSSRLEGARGSFESSSTFVVTVPSSSNDVVIEFSRNGLDWQVTNVRLPASSP